LAAFELLAVFGTDYQITTVATVGGASL